MRFEAEHDTAFRYHRVSKKIMHAIKSFFHSMFSAMGGVMLIVLYFSMSVGMLYWLWMAIDLGSFLMFLVLFSPLLILTGPIGIFSLVFGTPDWIVNLFG